MPLNYIFYSKSHGSLSITSFLKNISKGSNKKPTQRKLCYFLDMLIRSDNIKFEFDFNLLVLAI